MKTKECSQYERTSHTCRSGFPVVSGACAAEAIRLAREGEGDLVEGTDWRVIHVYAPRYAELEDKESPPPKESE